MKRGRARNAGVADSAEAAVVVAVAGAATAAERVAATAVVVAATAVVVATEVPAATVAAVEESTEPPRSHGSGILRAGRSWSAEGSLPAACHSEMDSSLVFLREFTTDSPTPGERERLTRSGGLVS
jgi:hypothetical protein